MSTAAKVPETFELTGDDARETLLETGRMQLLKDSFVRLRAADGFSHARSLAFVTSLVLVQGLIALVGFTSAFGELRVSREIAAAIDSTIPGPAGQLLTNAVEQAREVGTDHRFLPLLLGLLGTLITGMTAMGQIERGFNRIYGIERDRPSVEKYGRALVLAVGAGTGLALAFLLFAFGRESETAGGVLRTTWPYLRWPLGLLVATLALAALLQWSPRRRQPGWSWVGSRHGRARRNARPQLVVRRHLRVARGNRRSPDLDPALGDRDLLRRGGRRPARGDSGRCAEASPRAGTGDGRANPRVDDLRVVDPALNRPQKAPMPDGYAWEFDEAMRQVQPVLQSGELLLGDRFPAAVDDFDRVVLELLAG
jgi:uncharacterized BrkB/YihY/UPF0761 family membrane protein